MGGLGAAVWYLKQCWCKQCWFNSWCAGLGQSQNYRMVEVGREVCRSSCPGLLLRQGHPEPAAQDHVQASLLVSLAVVATASYKAQLGSTGLPVNHCAVQAVFSPIGVHRESDRLC